MRYANRRRRDFPLRNGFKATRLSSGVYLVELMVAIAIGAMLTFALLSTAASSMRHASTTQNEVYANTIVRQLIEATRSYSYEELAQHIGVHNLITNKISAGDIGPPVREEPVQLNTIDKIWQSATESGRFRGDVKYTVEAGPDVNNTLKVTVFVTWEDSTRYDSSNKREISASTIVSRYGVHKWSQSNL